MTITRRAAIGALAAISATGGAGAALASGQYPTPENASRALAGPSCPSLAELEGLIARHAAAWQADEAAHYAIPDDCGMLPKVQVGRILRGRDDDGKDIWQPIWAYHEKEIDDQWTKSLEATVAIHGRTPEREAEIRQHFARRIADAKADLARQEAEAKRIEDESGYTAAQERASAASDAVKAIEREIFAFVPTSLPAAARLAEWASETAATENGYVYKDDLRDVLRQIAKAGRRA